MRASSNLVQSYSERESSERAAVATHLSNLWDRYVSQKINVAEYSSQRAAVLREFRLTCTQAAVGNLLRGGRS